MEAPRVSESLGVTEGVHRAIDLAREAAQGYSNTQVDTEHLLLGLLQEKRRRKNFVAWCLGEHGITLRKVREQIESMWAPDSRIGEEVEFAFSTRLSRVVERAWQEARQLGYDEDDDLGVRWMILSTEHLLLALLEEPEGGAAQIFANLGIDRSQIRQTVMRMLGVHT